MTPHSAPVLYDRATALPMSDHAVFFDPSRRRWWWIKRIATLAGLFAVVVTSVFMLSVFVQPFLPGMVGITSALPRSLRHAIHLPPHGSQLDQYLLKQARKKLLAQIEKEQKAQHAKAALPPVKGSGIVAAFYAPWQETGLHSFRANANKMTHVMPAWVHLQ